MAWSKEPVTVLTFNEPEDAEPLKKRLEEAGIPATIYDERKLQRAFLSPVSLAGIRVRVPHENFGPARALLAEWDKQDGALRDAIHCPQCGLSRVEYPQFTRKFVLPSFGAQLCPLGLLEREFYCEDCHYTWPTKVPVPPKLDILGWPRAATAKGRIGRRIRRLWPRSQRAE